MVNFDLKNDFRENICKVLKTKIITFEKNDLITTYIEKRGQIGILFTGQAELVRYDINGNKVIVEKFNDNDLFGEFFYSVTSNNELTVIAKEKCEIIFFNYNDLFNPCITKGQNYYDTISKFMLILSHKIITMNTRIEVLSKRTIREKLLTYFEHIAKEKHSRVFYLDFSLSDLADYLSIDRSAMMREIKNLIDDGIIKKNNRKIKLIEH